MDWMYASRENLPAAHLFFSVRYTQAHLHTQIGFLSG